MGARVSAGVRESAVVESRILDIYVTRSQSCSLKSKNRQSEDIGDGGGRKESKIIQKIKN